MKGFHLAVYMLFIFSSEILEGTCHTAKKLTDLPLKKRHKDSAIIPRYIVL
jgi:hypothetical protein